MRMISEEGPAKTGPPKIYDRQISFMVTVAMYDALVERANRLRVPVAEAARSLIELGTRGGQSPRTTQGDLPWTTEPKGE